MTRKKTITRLALGLLIAAICLLMVELLWGKLFPFSPVAVGFTKYERPHSIFYVQQGADTSNLTRLDTLIVPVEAFHGMKFLHKPKLFLFRDSIGFIRHSLSKARFCVYQNGRLFISPWALKEDKRGIISLDVYVRHELSHSLIDQHAGLLHAFCYPQWLMEGIAVYSTHQMGTSFYPSKEDTYQYIRQGNFLEPLDFKTKREGKTKLDVEYRITFMYSEFACIVDYLIKTYGKEKLLSYMKQLFEGGDNNDVFKEVYSLEFEDVINDFKKQVIAQNGTLLSAGLL